MRNHRRQILVLAHRIPYPPNRGDRIRTFHFLEWVSARADVSLAFLSEGPPPAEPVNALRQRCARVECAVVGRAGRWLRAAWSAAVGRTATEGLFASPALRRTLARWGREVRFDAALVFCSSMAQYLGSPGLRGVPAVVDLIDVDSQKWFDYAATCRGIKRRLFAMEGRRLRRLEQRIPDQAAAVTLVSGHEASLYRSFCPASSIHVIPNGVDLDYFRPAPGGDAGNTQQCVFVGALDYRANVDGLRWFCDEAWPQVMRRRPEATLAVVGSNPSPDARRLAAVPGVRLVGQVDDVRPHLAAAAVVVVPLRVARGLQNKVLEAMAMGKAVVASPQALEGLAVEPEVEACRAGGAGEWADAVAGLLGDPGRREALGRAGRAYVETHHRWQDQLRGLAGLLGLPEGEEPADQAGAAPRQDVARNHV